MTIKVHGAAYPGIWVEKQVSFIKLTFSKDIEALAAADLRGVDGAAVTVAGESVFGVVESVLVKALKSLETRATVLGISKYDAATKSVDVFVGVASGWFADADGVIATGLPVVGAVARAVADGGDVKKGDRLSVAAGAVTFDMHYAAFRSLPVATEAAGDLENGVGATPGSVPVNSHTGTEGFYPVDGK